MPLGAITFLLGFGIVGGRPLEGFTILGHRGLAAGLIAFFGGIPALATGALAWFMRRKLRSFLAFAYVMSVIGSVVTALYLLTAAIVTGGFRWPPEILILIGGIAATGGVTAFCCSFLLWRSRPWTRHERPRTVAQSGNSLRLRCRRLRAFWEGWET